MKSWLIWKVKNANGVKIAPVGRAKPAPLLKFANLTKITNFLYLTNITRLSVWVPFGSGFQFAGEQGEQTANLQCGTRAQAAGHLNESQRAIVEAVEKLLPRGPIK